MKDRKECQHETLQFGSGDYYIFCKDCMGKWVAHNPLYSEYGYDENGLRIGADSNVCNPHFNWQENIRKK